VEKIGNAGPQLSVDAAVANNVIAVIQSLLAEMYGNTAVFPEFPKAL
jgi:hypothetical protein